MEGNSGGAAVTGAVAGAGGAAASGSVPSGGGGGGNDVELLCKTLQVEHKLFYFDLKENPSATRSTIIVPSSGISSFLDLFNYYVNSEDQDVFSKELQLDTKVFYFDIGENRRGRFLKINIRSCDYYCFCCYCWDCLFLLGATGYCGVPSRWFDHWAWWSEIH